VQTIESSARPQRHVQHHHRIEERAKSQTEVLMTVKDALERWATRGVTPTLLPSELEAVIALAWAMFEATRFVEAADMFQLVTLCSPQQARAWLGLGACREALGQRSSAQVAYEAASLAPIGADDRAHAVERLRILDEGPSSPNAPTPQPAVPIGSTPRPALPIGSTPRPPSSAPARDLPRGRGAQRRP
jgi:hypothetical protein